MTVLTLKQFGRGALLLRVERSASGGGFGFAFPERFGVAEGREDFGFASEVHRF